MELFKIFYAIYINRNIHSFFQWGPPFSPVASQINADHIFQAPFFNIRFSINFTLLLFLEDLGVDGSVIRTGLHSVLTVFIRCFLKFNGPGVFVPETGRKFVCSLSGRLS